MNMLPTRHHYTNADAFPPRVTAWEIPTGGLLRSACSAPSQAPAWYYQLCGATVKLPGDWGIPNDDDIPMPIECLAHVALHEYPVEQRNEEDIRAFCRSFGYMLEVDPACLAAPDLSTVFIVLQLNNPREIPCALRINYGDGSRSIVPVEILRVWDRSESLDRNGEHLPLFQRPAAAA